MNFLMLNELNSRPVTCMYSIGCPHCRANEINLNFLCFENKFAKIRVKSLTRFIDSKLIGEPFANSNGKLDCITSFFSDFSGFSEAEFASDLVAFIFKKAKNYEVRASFRGYVNTPL